jgi:4-amino-4-deoxy-L-arabinose transferase-like glycosyltransferase
MAKWQIANLPVGKASREWRKTVFFGGVILVVYFILRLVNLTILPVFVDEAIYIRWSQVMRAEPTLRFLPLSDGKQPLFMWLMIPFLKIFTDPLFAGRFLSILAGLGSLLGIFLLSDELFKDRLISLLASLLYTLIPFYLFFDRMALVDSMLSMLGIWIFYLGILLVRHRRLDLAMIAGMVLGGALITKSPAIFFAVLIPLAIVLTVKDLKRKPLQIFKLVVLWGVVYFFALMIYNLLRLGPNFRMIALRNKDYVFSLAEVLRHPWDPFRFHLREIFLWFGDLLTWPVMGLGLIGVVLGLKKNFEKTLLLLAWLVLPLLAQAEFAKVFTPRYLLFTAWPILILASYAALVIFKYLKKDQFFKKAHYLALALISFLLFLPAILFDFQLLANPGKAPLPQRMRHGYLEEWTAGQGIKEVANFLKERAKQGKVFVGTEGSFGTLPDGLQIYLEKVPNVTVLGVGYPIVNLHQSLVNSLVDNEVYLVVNQSRLQIPPEAYGLKLIAEYPKAIRPDGSQDKLLFFEVEKAFHQK